MVFLSKLIDLKKKGLHRNSKVFSAEIRNSRVFSGRILVISKQKKKVFTEIQRVFPPKSEIQGFVSGRNQKLKGFFRPNAGDFQKKKVSTEIQTGFSGRNQKFKSFFGRMQVISNKKKVFTKIQRVFHAEIRNSKGFSGRNQVISKK